MECKIKGYEHIEFKVGQQWQTRGGRVVEIVAVHNDIDRAYPIATLTNSYKPTGKEFEIGTTENDLITLINEPFDEPVDEPACTSTEIYTETYTGVNRRKNKRKCEIEGYKHIEFEVGQRWMTRGGEVVTIDRVFENTELSYPIEVGTISYTLKGREYKNRENKTDLLTLFVASVDKPVDESAEEPIEHRFESVNEPVCASTETYKDNEDLWEYSECSRIKVEEDTMLAPIGIAEPSVEDKMVDILHQLLAQRHRDLEKISLVFNTFIAMEKMK